MREIKKKEKKCGYFEPLSMGDRHVGNSLATHGLVQEIYVVASKIINKSVLLTSRVCLTAQYIQHGEGEMRLQN